MRSPYTQLYAHLTWSTWKRQPLITEEIGPRLYAAIAERCRQLQCEPVAIGGTDDHIHLLARLHTTVSIAQLVKEVKGSSSHLMTHEITPHMFFKWQGGGK
jgi:REP element-mobilizing transposase RayT